MADQALADARAKDRAFVKTILKNPTLLVWGDSIRERTLNPVEGVACAYGIKVACDRIADCDDLIVQKLRQAGLIILG